MWKTAGKCGLLLCTFFVLPGEPKGEGKVTRKFSVKVALPQSRAERGMNVEVDTSGDLYDELGKRIPDELLRKMLTAKTTEDPIAFNFRATAPEKLTIATLSRIFKKMEKYANETPNNKDV